MKDKYRQIDIGKKDKIGKRIYAAIEMNGDKVFSWDSVTDEEAWQQVASFLPGWSSYLSNKENFPGGLIERHIINNLTKTQIGVAFIGLKDFDRPDGFRSGGVGLNGAMMGLGYFPNKI